MQIKNIPGLTIKGEYFSEGMIGSAQRLYLRAKRGEYFFDICGAPFADGSFVSWWLVEETGCMKGCLSVIPLLGWPGSLDIEPNRRKQDVLGGRTDRHA